jgi:hypothetical protein
MTLTDNQRILVALEEAGPTGLHSHDLRRQGYSGNPSQRCKDLVSKGYEISTRREPVGRRPGSRFWLTHYAPANTTPVEPNPGDVAGGGAGASSAERASSPGAVGNDPYAPPPSSSGGLFDADDYRERLTWATQEKAA